MNASNITRISARGWDEFLSRSSTTIAVETSILILIGLIAIGGNLLVVISICRNRCLRTITNYIVLSLSLTDIVYSATVLPITITWSVTSRFIFGESLCDFQGISINALFFASVLDMVFMAINRFIKVCKSQRYQKLQTKKVTLVIISAIWICSFTFVIVYSKLGNFTSIGFKPNQIRCGFIYKKLHDTTSKIIGNTVLVLSLTVPFTGVMFCYFKVFKKIREHKRQIFPKETHELRNIPVTQNTQCRPAAPNLPSPQNNKFRDTRFSARNARMLGTSVQEIKVTWTLFAVLMGYCVSWIPVLIVSSASSLLGEEKVSRSAQMIITFTGSSSCVINPIIYGVMNPAFRREYKKIFSRK